MKTTKEQQQHTKKERKRRAGNNKNNLKCTDVCMENTTKTKIIFANGLLNKKGEKKTKNIYFLYLFVQNICSFRFCLYFQFMGLP